MKKNYYILILCLLSLVACSKEEKLTPSGAKENYFAVPEDATDAESVLRRDFYEQHRVHLLFNDTLYHELEGYYPDGTPYYNTELLDIRYSMTSQDMTEMVYEYLTDIDEQRKAVEIVENYILPHLGDGFLPYSMFLTRDLQTLQYGVLLTPITYYEGERCFAINAGNMIDATEDEIQSKCNDIFYSLVYSKMTLKTTALEDFYAYGTPYYSQMLSNWGISTFPTAEELQYMNSLGFLNDELLFLLFPSKSRDLENYLKAIFYDTEDNFKAMYAAYPVILEKYDILKEIIEELGFKF